MDSERLVAMANRIGDFFAGFPDPVEGETGIATHVARFWEPRMRRQLYAHLDGPAGGEGLAPLVAAALRQHREALRPADRDPLPVPPTGESEA
jgi:formate dehydrogenase subunit delta